MPPVGWQALLHLMDDVGRDDLIEGFSKSTGDTSNSVTISTDGNSITDGILKCSRLAKGSECGRNGSLASLVKGISALQALQIIVKGITQLFL